MTLHDILGNYTEIKHIQLIFGMHLVNIQTDVKGSNSLLNHFYNTHFQIISHDEEHQNIICKF